MQVIDLTGLPLAELRQCLTELPGGSAVVYVGFSTDVKEISNRTLIDINEAIREVLMLLHIELDEHGVLTKATLKEGLPV
jgi:hypothetical protein